MYDQLQMVLILEMEKCLVLNMMVKLDSHLKVQIKQVKKLLLKVIQ